MKSVLIISLFSILPLAYGQEGSQWPPAEYNGMPGCNSRYEFRRLWRNNFIPEQYWECVSWGQPAASRNCPPATRFQDAWQTCVPYNQWEWTPYSDPPTKPCEQVNECDEWIGAPKEPEIPPWECPDVEPTTRTTPTMPTTPTTSPSTMTPEVESSTTTESPTMTTTTEATTTTTEAVTTSTQSPLGQCNGANVAQHRPGVTDCSRVPPREDCHVLTVGRRIPTRDPYVYFECNFWSGWIQQRCPGISCFDGGRSLCIHPQIWNNVCMA